MSDLKFVEPTKFNLQSAGMPDYGSLDEIKDEAVRIQCRELYVRCYCLVYFEKYVVVTMKGSYTLTGLVRLISANIFFSVQEISSGFRFIASDKVFEGLDLTEVSKRIHLELLEGVGDEKCTVRILDDRTPKLSAVFSFHEDGWHDIGFELESRLKGMLQSEIAHLNQMLNNNTNR